MNPDRSEGPYHEFIRDTCRGNPSLEYLNHFMGNKQDNHCRIVVLDFGS
jgi:hypothetical protein